MFIIPTVHPSVQQERMSVCKACKFFVKSTGSCGTLIVGQSVEPEKVPVYRKKIRLCGCVMKWKTKYRLSSCPAGKWQPENLSHAEINQLREFIVPLSKQATINDAERGQLFKWFTKLTGQRQNATTCGACVKSVIDDLMKEINRLDRFGGGTDR